MQIYDSQVNSIYNNTSIQFKFDPQYFRQNYTFFLFFSVRKLYIVQTHLSIYLIYLLYFIYRASLFSIFTTLIYHKVIINNKTEQDTEQDKQTQILVEQFTNILTQIKNVKNRHYNSPTHLHKNQLYLFKTS